MRDLSPGVSTKGNVQRQLGRKSAAVDSDQPVPELNFIEFLRSKASFAPVGSRTNHPAKYQLMKFRMLNRQTDFERIKREEMEAGGT